MKIRKFSYSLILVLVLSLALPTGAWAAPSNDNFADTTHISSLPYSVFHNTSGATFEDGEPYPSCGSGYGIKTAWFAFTPSTDQTLVARSDY